jgi:hypothetical protein
MLAFIIPRDATHGSTRPYFGLFPPQPLPLVRRKEPMRSGVKGRVPVNRRTAERAELVNLLKDSDTKVPGRFGVTLTFMRAAECILRHSPTFLTE